MTIDTIDQDGLKLAAETGEKYLGNHRLVDGLVRAFAQSVAGDYAEAQRTGTDLTAKVQADCQRMADIFLGRNTHGFAPQPWNSERRLGTQLRVALKCGDQDPGVALFEHLAQCVLAGCINHGEGEAEDTVRDVLERQIGQVVIALLGAPEKL